MVWFLLLPGPALAQVHDWDITSRGQGSETPGGLPNGGFETDGLTGWRTDYNWSGGQGFPPGHVWEVKVGTEYAHSGNFGCRVYNANNPSWSGAWLVSQDFKDTSEGYSMWLKLAGGCTTYWSGVVIGIVEVASGKEIRYEGNVSGDAWHHSNTIDRYFKLTPGEWQECRFDFAKDFRAKYGAVAGSLRRIYVNAYQDTDYCDIYVDDIKGYGGAEEAQLVTSR